MKARCYNETASNYSNYGAKGVTVAPEWHDFKGFLADVPKIPGWDPDRYVTDRLSLDKDVKWGNKLYSLDTCRFVTKTENNKIKPNQQYRMVAMSPEGEIYYFQNASEFSREHKLDQLTILRCAKGEYIQHFGWQFCMEEDYNGHTFKDPYSWNTSIVGLSPEGKRYVFYNATEFARTHGLIEATVIYACAGLKNTHTRGWQFRYTDEEKLHPFLPKEKLIFVGKRNVPVMVTSPEGDTFEITNRQQFARDRGMTTKSILRVLRGEVESYKGWKFSWK